MIATIIIASGVIITTILWKLIIKLTAKEVYWEDGSKFYYRRWSLFSDQYHLTIYVKKKLSGIVYLEKIKTNSIFYYKSEINELEKIKTELKKLIGEYIKDNIVQDEMGDWDGELFEPTKQRSRDRKIEKILSGK
jgi:hypothetical protein